MTHDLRDYVAMNKINAIAFLFDQYKLVLVVEGSTDLRIYARLFPTVYIYHAKGKSQVKETLRVVPAKCKDRCRALIDRDYDFFLHKEFQSERVVYTDAHSLETLMWMTDSERDILPSIVNEMIDYRTIYETQQKMPHMYDAAENAAYWVGLLRLGSMREGWRISFQSYQFTEDLFFPDSDRLNVDLFLKRLLSENEEEEDFDEVKEAVSEIAKAKPNKWEIMQGHDLSAAFVYFIKKNCTFYPPDWNGWDDPKVALNDFESKTRSACDINKLKQTDFYRAIHGWACGK